MLVVEDEAGYRAYLARFLEAIGLDPAVTADADEGFAAAVRMQPALVLSDWCLRGRSGLELVRDLRADARTQHLPVVLMSSIKESIEDEVRALEAGADRFLLKNELVLGNDGAANLKRHLAALIVLGMQRAEKAAAAKVLQIGNLRLDPARAEASIDGRVLKLCRKEFELLEFFARRPGVIHSAEKIWRAVWATPPAGGWEHTLATTLSSLRRGLGFEWSSRLVNTKTLGYRLLFTALPSRPTLSRPR